MQDTATAGKKRMLEGHAPGGPEGKRSKHEERSVNPADASGTAPAPYPSAAKKPRKAPALCEHRRRRSKDCGGGGLCEHQRRRSRCKDCGGGSLCEHQRVRSEGKDCGGGSFCEHQRQRSQCKDCGGSGLCKHQRRKGRVQRLRR